jgi:ribonuclease H2 subunit C
VEGLCNLGYYIWVFLLAFRGSFRGIPLRGTSVNLPAGYIGVVLHESIAPLYENEERKFHVVNKFKSLNYWNWDKIPSQNDKIVQALEWIEIAEALHSPITQE